MEALSGEAKTFVVVLAAESFRKSAKEKSFVAVTRDCSAVVRGRGRASRAGGWLPPLGSVAEQAEATTTNNISDLTNRDGITSYPWP
jgi:hypothetical protein